MKKFVRIIPSILSFLIVVFLFILFTHNINKFPVSELCERIQGPYNANDSALVAILKTKFIDLPSVKSYNFSHDPLYKIMKNNLSWPFIYYYTKNLFGNYSNGFFVEAGALDGEFLSNTLWLERELNWTGLLIEPDPNNYKELLLKNRKSWTSNTCISSEWYPKKSIFIGRRRLKGIEPTNIWIFRGTTNEVGYSNESVLDNLFSGSTSTYYSVQCFPLITYILALNRTEIDFLSLDIQGAELDVLKSFPFDQINVRVMAIEHGSLYYDKRFVQFFKEKGFEVIGCNGEPDYIFIKSNLAPHIKMNIILNCPIN